MLDPRYMAGLFDGEGFVRIDTYKPKCREYPRYQMLCGIGMTDRPVIDRLYEQFGGTFMVRHYNNKISPVNRHGYYWTVSSKNAFAFLVVIKPHLIVKAEQVKLAIELQREMTANKGKMVGFATREFKETVYAKRHAIALEITRLKKLSYSLEP